MTNLVKLLVAFATSTVLLFVSLFMYGALTGYASQPPGQYCFSLSMGTRNGLMILALDLIMILVLRKVIPKIVRVLSAFLLVPFGAAVLSFLVILAVFALRPGLLSS